MFENKGECVSLTALVHGTEMTADVDVHRVPRHSNGWFIK